MPSRLIREGFLDSDALAQAGEAAEVLFTRLMLVADDYGRFDGRVTVICRRCWPLGGPSEGAVAERLAALAAAGLVQAYEVDGKPFICITKFNQRLRLKNASKYPDPPEQSTGIAQTHGTGQTNARQMPVACAPEVEVEVEVNQPPPTTERTGDVGVPAIAAGGGNGEVQPQNPDSKALELASICIVNRVTGATLNSPHIAQWLREGVSPKLLRDSIAEARATTKPEPALIPIKYLLPIVERLRAGPRPSDGAWRKDEKRAIAKGVEVGVSPRAGEEMFAFIARIDQALQERARSQVQ